MSIEKAIQDRLNAQKEHIGGSIDGFEKGGVGSKGGKVIGYTKSGKPIYDSNHATKHSDFSKQDHKEAHGHHKDEIKRYKKLISDNPTSDKKSVWQSKVNEHETGASVHKKLGDGKKD